VYNYFFGIQHEILPKTVLELNYVGTTGHKLFRAENANRQAGSRLPAGVCNPDIFGEITCSNRSALNTSGRRLNPNYGRLRVWENVVNSNYNSFQASLRHQLSHRVQFNVHYTWSHSIDGGSTWHSGATSANGRAAGEGFTTDQAHPNFDRSNSIYDVRHRLGVNYVIELPGQGLHGFSGAVLGGWQVNGLVSFQSGAHWSPFCGGFFGTCDFNKDGEANDRPSSDVSNFNPTHDQWADGWGPTWVFGNTDSLGNPLPGLHFTDPNPGCAVADSLCTANPGNLGRNTFVGPKFWSADMSLFKNFKITERVNFQFRAESFNLFNHTNFRLPGNDGNNQVQKSTFGCACSTFDPRVLQFGAKVSF
jgi:hypothetical protein